MGRRDINEVGVDGGVVVPFTPTPKGKGKAKPERQAPAAGDDGRPAIKLGPDMPAVIEQAIGALDAHLGARPYQRSGALVHVVRDARPVRGIRRPEGAATIAAVGPDNLRERLAVAATWLAYDKRGEDYHQTWPTMTVARTVAARGEWPFPYLAGVTETPALRPDGTVLDAPGYDAATGYLYQPSGVFPVVPQRPTRDDAARALAELGEPFAEFPFTDDSDRAVAIALVLTLVGRAAINGPVPMFALRATTPASGKSLLARAASIIGTGREPTLTAAPPSNDDAEWRKRITALAAEGAPAVLIDNVEGVLGSASLAAALTSPTWTDRVLGTSGSRTVPMLVTWIATGNGLHFRGDLGRRVIPCDMDPRCEHPEDRTFRVSNLLAHVERERARLVVAALTLLRAYHVAGRPAHGKAPMGSFEAWDSLVRGAAVWSGGADPCKGRERVREDGDADLSALGAALAAWHAAYGAIPTSAADAVKRASGDADMTAALAELARCDAAKLDANRLGYALRRVRGRVVGGRRFDAVKDEHRKVVRWAAVE